MRRSRQISGEAILFGCICYCEQIVVYEGPYEDRVWATNRLGSPTPLVCFPTVLLPVDDSLPSQTIDTVDD